MSRSIVVFLTLLAISGMAFSINISSCQLITSPGTYDVTASFSGTTNNYYYAAYTTCVLINNTQNVVIDCHGYSITETAGGSGAPIAARNSSNIVIRNCNLSGARGLAYNDANYTTARNNNISAGWGVTSLGDNYYHLYEYNNIVAGSYGFFWPVENSTIRYNNVTATSVAYLLSGHNSITDNYAYNTPRCYDSSDGDDLRRNIAFNCSSSCYEKSGSQMTTFINNTADNCGNGYYTYGDDVSLFQNNIIRNVDNGVYIRTYFGEGINYAGAHVIDNNDITDCTTGIRGYYDVFNNYTSNTIDGCTGDGVFLEYSQFDRLVSNDVRNNGESGMELNNVGNSTLSNNYVTGNTDGFYLRFSDDNYLSSNTAEDTNRGFVISNSDYNFFSGNTAYNNQGTGVNGDGMYISSSDYNNFTGNNITDNDREGIQVESSDYNQFTGDYYVNNGAGIMVSTNSDNNNLTGCEAYDNNQGLYLYYTQNNILYANDVHDNSIGIELYWHSNDTEFIENEVYDNTNGIYIRASSGISLTGDHLYSNGNDFVVRSGGLGVDYTMDGVVFDSDAGTYTDYTNLSASDATTDQYDINWDSEPAALPFPLLSFNNKFVEIDDSGSADTIDSITWHWTNGELGGLDESQLQLWEYDSSWSLANGTPDTANNEFEMANLAGFSTFAILAGGACPAPLTSAGTYTLTGDISGSTNDASPIVGTTCVLIASSDVVFDCDGYSITNNGTTGTTHAIVSNGTFTNVTVQNCPIMSDYRRGLFFYQTSNGAILNSGAQNNTDHGFSLNLNTNNNIVDNVTATGNGYSGFYLSNSDFNNLTDTHASGNSIMGYFIQNSDNNRFVDSTANNNNDADGFRVTTSTGNTFLNCNASGPTQNVGFHLDRGSGHNLTGCNADQNDIGFFANDSNNNDFININGSNGDDGLRMDSADGNLVDPSYFCDNNAQGVHLLNSNSNTVSDSTMCRNGRSGIYLDSSINNDLLRNTAFDNTGRGIDLVSSSNGNNITANNLTNNDEHGIRINESDNNDVYDNTATLNYEGIRLRDSDYNTIVRNVANSNTRLGFSLGTAIGPSSSYNVIDNNTANLNGWAGFGAGYSSNNNVTNNIFDSNVLGGVGFANESNLNLIANNVVVGNPGIGILVQDNSGPNTIRGNYVEGSAYGLIVNKSNATDSVDNEITQASLSGIYIYDSDSSGFLRGHLYNNTVDMEIESAFSWSFSMRMDNVIFDNPAGNMTNYSNVSVDDIVENDGNHRFTWSAEPATPPVDFRSFQGKYLEFDRFFGSPVIDELRMHWLEAELAPDYTEASLRLASENGSWNFLNVSPDETNNELSFAGLDDDQVLGILEFVSVGDEDTTGGDEKELEMGFSSTCEANIITATSSGNPVSGVDVMVLNKNTLEDVASGTTDSNGEFSFMGCGIPIKVSLSKDGYQSYSTTKTMIICSECELECGEDADCSDKEHCKNNLCQRVECSCGYVEDHECISYQCCADSDCEALQACMDNLCVDHYECASNEDCEATEYCDIAENASAGFCEDVTGVCGEVEDHEWVQYECGDEEGCPECPDGYECDDNKCEPIRDLEGPDSGFVGEEVRVNATEAGGVCADCEVQIKLPDGKILNGKTDSNGNLDLPLNLEGAYELTLLKDGEPVETIKVNALPKPVVPDEEPDTQVLDEMANVIFLILLLTVLLAGIIYWRRKGSKK